MSTATSKKQGHIRLLLGLVVLELALLGALFVPRRPARVVMGFLIKKGASYMVAWKREHQDFETRDYTSLKDAMHFVRTELKLSEGRNPLNETELEHVWMNDRFGNTVLLWKALRFSIVNQMTFQNRDDAGYFLNAFRRGSYAPSMFGHSILFVPQRNAVN